MGFGSCMGMIDGLRNGWARVESRGGVGGDIDEVKIISRYAIFDVACGL